MQPRHQKRQNRKAEKSKSSSLRNLVGAITTPDQIIKAGQYYDGWRSTEEDDIKKEAWNAHMASKEIDDERVGAELKF